MADETKPVTGETVTETATEEVKETTEATETELTAERFKRMEDALKKANKEAEKNRKAVEAFQQAEQAKKEAELSEVEKLRLELEKAKTQAAQAERTALTQKIAAETGLPVIFADRLKGDDEEALREDAAKLLETIKTPAAQKQAKVEPTMPTNAAKPESETQKANRILRPAEAGPFDIEGAKKLGGGVIINNG